MEVFSLFEAAYRTPFMQVVVCCPCSCEAFQAPLAELRAELYTVSQELHTEARDLSAAVMQQMLDAHTESERSQKRRRCASFSSAAS